MMRVKDLIEKLKQFDPESMVLTTRYSDLMHQDEPKEIQVFQHEGIISEFDHTEWKHNIKDCYNQDVHIRDKHDNFAYPPPTVKAVYFKGN